MLKHCRETDQHLGADPLRFIPTQAREYLVNSKCRCCWNVGTCEWKVHNEKIYVYIYLIFVVFLEKYLHEVCFVWIKEQVREKSSRNGSQMKAECLLQNTYTKQNKNVLKKKKNQKKIKHFHHVIFRKHFVRIRVLLFKWQDSCTYADHCYINQSLTNSFNLSCCLEGGIVAQMVSCANFIWVPLVEQELLTFPEHMSSSQSEARMACVGHVCEQIGTKWAIFIENLP